MDNQQERLKLTMRATWVSVGVNTTLTLLQIIVGMLAHSQALLAHGLHSFSDLLSDFLVIFAAKRAAQAADQNHPYGHARFETAATLILGISLAWIGFYILKDCFELLLAPSLSAEVGQLALWIAVVTVIFKELLFHYLKQIALKLHSQLLLANALHTRADSLSALVVVIGIAGTFLGFPIADLLAALVMGLMILRMGAQLIWESLSELTDQGLNAERVLKIQTLLKQSSGVLDVHDLKTRKMGQNVLVEAHLEVLPNISVTEGHRIAENARAQVLAHEKDVIDVAIHIDPQDQTHNPDQSWQHLPSRAEILTALHPVLRHTDIQIFPNYIGGALILLVLFPQHFQNPKFVENQMKNLLKENKIQARMHSFVALEDETQMNV